MSRVVNTHPYLTSEIYQRSVCFTRWVTYCSRVTAAIFVIARRCVDENLIAKWNEYFSDALRVYDKRDFVRDDGVSFSNLL